MSLLAGQRLRLWAIAWTAGILGVSLALGGSTASGAAVPKGQHCGLFRAATQWVDAEHVKGYFYSYGAVHMRCAAQHPPAASNPAVIATLAVDGHLHPYGFKCVVGGAMGDGEDLHSGYCVKGNPHRAKKLQSVVWGAEAECPIPDPPYTPESDPPKCHT